MGEGEKPEEEVEWGEEEGEEGPFSRGRSVPVRESAAISIKTAPAAPVISRLYSSSEMLLLFIESYRLTEIFYEIPWRFASLKIWKRRKKAVGEGLRAERESSSTDGFIPFYCHAENRQL